MSSWPVPGPELGATVASFFQDTHALDCQVRAPDGGDQKQPCPVFASSRQLSLTLRISPASCLTVGDLTWNQNAYIVDICPPRWDSALTPIPPRPKAVHQVITCLPVGLSLDSWPTSWKRRPAVSTSASRPRIVGLSLTGADAPCFTPAWGLPLKSTDLLASPHPC